MRKKLLVTCLAVSLGIVLLFTSAFAGATSNAGYDLLKDAWKNSQNLKSFTADLKFSVDDNGKNLLSAQGSIKASKDKELMSGKLNIAADDVKKALDVYCGEDKFIIKEENKEEYQVISHDEKHKNRFRKHHEMESNKDMSEIHEFLMDTLVGNLKNQIQSQKTNTGSNKVELDLSGSQIPAPLNTLISLGIKNKGEKHKEMQKDCPILGIDLSKTHPELEKDIRIAKINLSAEINKESFVEKTSATFIITGKDAQGKKHEIKISLNINLSGINSTTPDTIDLTGKKVINIDPSKIGHCDSF
ncbi:MAG: hypothetical protein N2645_15950 [Clostridia bacterium]|nr:hypothetical protein [Clostridia bacterium]